MSARNLWKRQVHGACIFIDDSGKIRSRIGFIVRTLGKGERRSERNASTRTLRMRRIFLSSDGMWESDATVISDQVRTHRVTPFEVVRSGDGVASEWYVGDFVSWGVRHLMGLKRGKMLVLP